MCMVYIMVIDRLLTASNQKTTLQVLANIIITNNCTLKIWNINEKASIGGIKAIFAYCFLFYTQKWFCVRGA